MELSEYLLNNIRDMPKIVKNRLEDDNGILPERRIMLQLHKYADDFIAGNDSNRLIIIPGLRGVGKTTSVLQFWKYLTIKHKVNNENILYISMDDVQAITGKKLSDVIAEYIENIHQKSFADIEENIFILIDEAHFDKDWDKTIKVFYEKTKKIFFVITGSSALSLEMSVDTARRSSRKTMFPLGFSEYLIMKDNFYPPRGTAAAIRDVIVDPKWSNIDVLNKMEKDIARKSVNLSRSIGNELRHFSAFGGFAFGLRLDGFDVFDRINDMLERVIRKDVPMVHSFSFGTQNTILRIITYLALQSPGEISQNKLANRLSVSPTQINQALDALEKTHVLFSLKPHGGSCRVSTKPWKYYFLTSTLTAAIYNKMGKFDIRSNEIYGKLAENMVASYFFRMKETVNMPINFFYDSGKNGVDFVLFRNDQTLIPIEVTVGNKDEGQIKRAISRYKANHGVVICDCKKTEIKDNVLYIPLTTFAFV